MDNNIIIPIEFAIGETFTPPALLWQYNLSGIWTPLDLTGFNSVFTARQTLNSIDPALILANVDNGMISVDGPNGSIQLVLPSSYTATLTPFEGVWDWWAYSPASPAVATLLCRGTIRVNQAVGRA
jgi:hypothetical protein